MTDDTIDTGDTVDSTDSADTQEVTAKKGRGRPKGSKSAPRDVICVCHEGSNVKVITLQGYGSNGKNEDLLQEAKDIFKAEFGVDDCKAEGPFWARHGESAPTQKRDSVTISKEQLLDLEYTSFKASAIYKDWDVAVRGIKGRDDALWVIFKSHRSDSKKNAPGPKVIKKDALQDIKPV